MCWTKCVFFLSVITSIMRVRICDVKSLRRVIIEGMTRHVLARLPRLTHERCDASGATHPRTRSRARNSTPNMLVQYADEYGARSPFISCGRLRTRDIHILVEDGGWGRTEVLYEDDDRGDDDMSTNCEEGGNADSVTRCGGRIRRGVDQGPPHARRGRRRRVPLHAG
jgi:hypothetical protein